MTLAGRFLETSDPTLLSPALPNPLRLPKLQSYPDELFTAPASRRWLLYTNFALYKHESPSPSEAGQPCFTRYGSPSSEDSLLCTLGGLTCATMGVSRDLWRANGKLLSSAGEGLQSRQNGNRTQSLRRGKLEPRALATDERRDFAGKFLSNVKCTILVKSV